MRERGMSERLNGRGRWRLERGRIERALDSNRPMSLARVAVMAQGCRRISSIKTAGLALVLNTFLSSLATLPL
jgi:hypothetical protein